MINFVAGLCVGSFISVIMLALVNAASNYDRMQDNMLEYKDDEQN